MNVNPLPVVGTCLTLSLACAVLADMHIRTDPFIGWPLALVSVAWQLQLVRHLWRGGRNRQ